MSITNLKDALELQFYFNNSKKEPNIIAFGEFAGFPNPITRKLTTYMDYLEQVLAYPGYSFKGISSTHFYDFQSVLFQKSQFISTVLSNNPTVEEVYQILKAAMKLEKSKSFNRMVIRKRIPERYSNYTEGETVHDILKTGHGTIILRASLASDISYKLQENAVSVLFKKGNHYATEIIQEHKDQMIDEIIKEIIHNYRMIYAINPQACIIELGITLPKLFQMQKNMHVINEFILDLTESLKAAAAKEDVAYIDGISFERNTLSYGQEILCDRIFHVLAQKIPFEKTHSVSDDIYQQFHNNGITGMISEKEEEMKSYAKILGYEKNTKNCNRVMEAFKENACYHEAITQIKK